MSVYLTEWAGSGSSTVNAKADQATNSVIWGAVDCAPAAILAGDGWTGALSLFVRRSDKLMSYTEATAGRTRPLCEYPAYPKYNSSRDIGQAASFSCIMPDASTRMSVFDAKRTLCKLRRPAFAN